MTKNWVRHRFQFWHKIWKCFPNLVSEFHKDLVRRDAQWFSLQNHKTYIHAYSFLWRHNGHGVVWNHQPYDCLLNRLIRAQIKENIKAPRHWPLCGEFTRNRWIPAQMASDADNVSFWWRHHAHVLRNWWHFARHQTPSHQSWLDIIRRKNFASD